MALEWTMLSMVSANRFIHTVVMPVAIIAYGAFLLIDHGHENQVDPASRDHIQRIQKIGSIDGLLFGGSNAAYSVSAYLLSRYMGIKWYNASVIEELRTIEWHKNFIQDLSARIDRTKVRFVIYSSYLPYAPGTIARFESKQNLGIGIKPKINVLQYTRHRPSRNLFPQRNKLGDIVFENVNCRFNAGYPVSHLREDVDISAEFLADYAIFFASLFPNASILIVLPSEYYGALSFDDSTFEQTLRRKFYNTLNARYFQNPSI